MATTDHTIHILDIDSEKAHTCIKWLANKPSRWTASLLQVPYIDLKMKIAIFMAIPVKMVLWGCTYDERGSHEGTMCLPPLQPAENL